MMTGLVNDATGVVTPPAMQAATTTNAYTGMAQSSDATGVGYTGAQTKAQQMAASTAGLTTNAVTAPETVASQLKGLVDDNSPLLQQARATALANMNGRGLLNSSMAETGAQTAVLNTALPIAQQDASTYLTTAQANQAASNQNAQYNASNTQDASKTNATLGTSVAQSNQQSTNAGLSADAAAKNAASAQNAQQKTQTSQFNTAAENAASSQNAQAANSTSQFNANASNAATTQALDSQTKIALQAMDGASKVQLANIQAQYQKELQSSQSAQSIYGTIVGNISTIMQNPDMDAGAKQAAVNQQVQMLKDGMAVAGSVASVNLGSLLTFTSAPAAAAPSASLPAASSGVNPNQDAIDRMNQTGAYSYNSGNTNRR